MKGQKDKKPGVKLLMVINVSLAFFVGRDPLGALLDFHLTLIVKIAFPKIWFSFFLRFGSGCGEGGGGIKQNPGLKSTWQLHFIGH